MSAGAYGQTDSTTQKKEKGSLAKVISPEKDYSNFPKKQLYVGVYDIVSFPPWAIFSDAQLDLGLKTYRKKNLYFGHHFLIGKTGISMFDVDDINLIYEFDWVYRYQLWNREWLFAEWSFGPAAGWIGELNQFPGLGMGIGGQLQFEFGSWGNLSISTRTRVLNNPVVTTDADGQPNGFHIDSDWKWDHLRVGANFYLKGKKKKEPVLD